MNTSNNVQFSGPHVRVQVGPLIEVKSAAELASDDEVRQSDLLTLVETDTADTLVS
jgi:hypothetical protein